MVTIRVGRRGQITIPREIRRSLDIQEGDAVAFIPDGDRAVLRKIEKTLLDMRGSVPVPEVQDFEKIRGQVLADRARKNASDER